MSLWLVGTGSHAVAYAKVLRGLKKQFEVVGRGRKSAWSFSKEIKMQVHVGGVKNILKTRKAPQTAIVAVSFDQLAVVAADLIKAGTKKILLEKPGALCVQELLTLCHAARKHKAKVWIGYNRRFYSSAILLHKRIKIDGGALSCNFELTEWAGSIVNWQVSSLVKKKLFVANSSHVADLAFYLCGQPDKWKGWSTGSLPWHKNGARFSGAGITKKGVLFSYHADWEAPGRWCVEVLTRKKRYILRPLELLSMQSLKSQKIHKVQLNDRWDRDFKPGLYLQTKAFLGNNQSRLCTLANQVQMLRVYSNMAGYEK